MEDSAPKKRQRREVAFGAAVAKVRELGTVEDFAERYIEAAVSKAQDEAIGLHAKKLAAILDNVHPSTREMVLLEAIPTSMTPPGGEPHTGQHGPTRLEEEQALLATLHLPPGAQPLSQERLAIGRKR